MAKKHLLDNPIHARMSSLGERTMKHPDVWWYEEPGAITLCFSSHGNGTLARIPIGQLRAFIERHDREGEEKGG